MASRRRRSWARPSPSWSTPAASPSSSSRSGSSASTRTSSCQSSPPQPSATETNPGGAHMKSSLEIAQEAELIPIEQIAESCGLQPEEIEPYGRYKAKINLSVIERLADRPDGKIVCVAGMTPTKAGEGKTTTLVGLTQGMGHIGKRAVACRREPSLGPVFGIKGGAAGGGMTQVVPMEDLNLHFTGDIHAIGAAKNLLAAMLEAHLLHGNELGIDPLLISWRRCVYINDRALRAIAIGIGSRANGSPRQTGFDTTA